MKQQVFSKLSIAFLSIFLFQSVTAQQKAAAILDDYFIALHANRQFSGNVLVAEEGKIIYERSFGYADFPAQKLNSTNILFPIASISKTLTATGILQQIEKGNLRLTDPVVKYFPDFPYPAITIRHLLSHTSGLPPYNAFFDSIKAKYPGRVFTNRDFMAGLAANKKPLIYQPGEKVNYDNINFIVLALILEKVSGKSLEDYIKKNILKPAGMHNTEFFSLSVQFDPTKEMENFAFPHLYPHLYSDLLVKSNTVPYIQNYWHAYNFSGFGDYISTVHDLLKYDKAFYSSQLLTEATLREAFIPVRLNNGSDNPDEFGLGWEIEKDTSLGKIVYHSGAATGLSCIILRNISLHQTVILFDNMHFNAHEIATNALAILNGRKIQYPGKSIANIYGKVLVNQGPAAASDTLYRLKKDTINYELSEDEINSLGYDLMGENNTFHFPEAHRYKDAVEAFKINMELFPSSWNVYDSYGESLLKIGKKEEAIKMYQRSIELNPKNEGGKKMLADLLK